MNWWDDMATASQRSAALRPKWRTIYQILDKKSGTVALRRMRWHPWSTAYTDADETTYYEELDGADQTFAVEVIDEIQKACAYFYADDYTPLEAAQSVVVSDADVRARIDRMQGGNLKREARRTNLEQYPLHDLPFEDQRALVSNIEALKATWKYKKMGIYIPPEQAEAAIAALDSNQQGGTP